MRKFLTGRIFTIIITAIICITGTVHATTQILASEISYKNGTVESALNALYDKANSTDTICIKQSGTSEAVSAKYLCELGDGISRSFYILAVNGNNVKMIMEKNISDEINGSSRTMSHSDAMEYFDEGKSGYSVKQAWLTKVKSVDLPDAQDIASAGDISEFNINQTTSMSYFGVNSQSDTSRRSSYSWLYNYNRACLEWGNCSEGYGVNDANHAYGYWTKDAVVNDNTKFWFVGSSGNLDNDNGSDRGIRPVITISKTSLAG